MTSTLYLPEYNLNHIEDFFLIDRGSTSKIILGKNKKHYTLFKLFQFPFDEKHPLLQKELSRFFLLSYKFYPQFLGVIKKTHNTLLAYDYIPGISLFLLMHLYQQKHLPAQLVQKITFQMLLHVVNLHNQGIAHTDLHDHQWLWTQKEELFLVDLGTTVSIEKNSQLISRKQPQKFSTFYPWEMFCDDKKYQGTKVDSWQIGYLIYQLITSSSPFSEPISLSSFYESYPIYTRTIPSHDFNHLHNKSELFFFDELFKVALKLLSLWPQDRPDLQDILKLDLWNLSLPDYKKIEFYPYPHTSSLNLLNPAFLQN